MALKVTVHKWKCVLSPVFYIFTDYYDYDYEVRHVVGAIQAEKESECSNKTFSIVVHNITLVSFETQPNSISHVLKFSTILAWEFQRRVLV